MNYKIVNTVEKKKWSEFVSNHPNGNIFQTPEMNEAYQNTKKYEPFLVAALDDNGNILGLLLAVIQTECTGFLGNFTARSIIFGGPLIKNNDSIILDSILKEYNKIIKKKAIYSQFRNMWDWGDLNQVFLQNNINFDDHLNILVDVSIGAELLWKGVKRNRKDGINKAKKQSFKFVVNESGTDLNSFYSLLSETYKRAKLPFPKNEFFKNIAKFTQDKCIWFEMSKDNELIIVLLGFIYKDTLYAYYLGCTGNSEILRLRPVDLFYWKVMEWANIEGLNYFDWMGAGKPDKEYGVRKFKLQYGGSVYNFGRYEQVHKKFLMTIGKLGIKLLKGLK